METLFPPMSFAVLAFLAAIIIFRPVILRARVPQHPPEPIGPVAETGSTVLNGAANFIARVAPNKALSSLR
jgi:hypothetical protein